MKISAWLVLILPLVAAPLHAGQVYKWVDARGNVHYSDKPHPGAKQIKIAPPQSYSASGSAHTAQQPAPPADAQPGAPAQPAIAISSPTPGQSLWNVHDLTVSVTVTPGLEPGDSVTFNLDGKSQGPVNSTSVTFKDVIRGEHTVSASLTRASGAEFSAAPVRFYIHQTSILHRKPPG